MKATITMLLANPLEPDPRVRKEAAFLVKKGFDVVVYAWDWQQEHPTHERSNGFHIVRLQVPSSYGNWLRQM